MNAPLPAGAMTVATAPTTQFAPSLTNRTHSAEYIADLAATMKPPIGVLQPITARPWPASRGPAPEGVLYEIIMGEGRCRAAPLAGLTEIPFFWRDVDDRTALQMQLIENLKRKDLTPLEEAAGYRRLMQDHGYTAERIASEINKSRATVYAMLKLLDLIPVAKEALEAGLLDASKALLIARMTPSMQKLATKKITTQGVGGEPMSFRGAKDLVRFHMTKSLKEATFSLVDATLRPEAGSCEACPKRSGNIPEICEDLVDPDVCTDPDCFKEKWLTKRERLLNAARERNIPVLCGNDARSTYYNSSNASLDDAVEGDGQQRSYRQILGDEAPIKAIVKEVNGAHDQRVMEVADKTTLHDALVKAGWTPDLFKATEDKEQTAKQAADQAKQDAERKANAERQRREREAHEAECERREALLAAVLPALEYGADTGRLNPEAAIVLLAMAHIRQEADWNDTLEESILESHGITLPDTYEIYDELPKVCAAVATWSMGKALSYLFNTNTCVELRSRDAAEPPTLLALAKLVGIDPRPFRKVEDSFSVGDRIRIAEGLHDKNGKLHKYSGREGTVEAIAVDDVTCYTIRFGPGARGIVVLERKDLIKLDPESPDTPANPTPAAQASESGVENKTEAALAGDEDKAATKAAAKKAKGKSTPAPASPANEPATPLKTASLNPAPPWPFPSGAVRERAWPKPNENGVYSEADAQKITFELGRASASILILEIETGWIWANHSQGDTETQSGRSEPLSAPPVVETRDHAIRAAANEHLAYWDSNQVFKKPLKFRIWADDLFMNGEASAYASKATGAQA